MTLRGVDISNWQAGIVPSALDVDFCIVKATEGLGFIDQYCDGFVQDCIANGVLWGFYHFAQTNEPESEARFFYENCTGYIGHGVPVLDYEVTNSDNVAWCERFIREFYRLSGVWPMLYISASRCPEYNGSWIPEKCGLWVAGYPQAYTGWTNDDMPYSIAPWEFAAIWQFTSSLQLRGWTLDGDIAYMDRKAWGLYAGVSDTTQPGKDDSAPDKKTCEDLAKEVLAGKWGDGWNRQQALDSAYGAGTYEHVQEIVNRMVG